MKILTGLIQKNKLKQKDIYRKTTDVNYVEILLPATPNLKEIIQTRSIDNLKIYEDHTKYTLYRYSLDDIRIELLLKNEYDVEDVKQTLKFCIRKDISILPYEKSYKILINHKHYLTDKYLHILSKDILIMNTETNDTSSFLTSVNEFKIELETMAKILYKQGRMDKNE